MHVDLTNLCRKGLIALALGWRLAAQVSNDYETVRFRASAALESGDTAEAEKLYEQGLDLRRRTFGENSAPYAAALLDLARVYQVVGKRSGDAVRLYQQALPIQEATLGPDHPDVATTLLYLALATPRDRSQPDAVRQLYQRALDIRTKAFGAADPRVAEVLTPLARLNEDETLYQRAMVILDAAAQPTPLMATTLELYARYLRAHDRGGEADALEARAKPIRTARVAEIGARRAAVEPKPLRVGDGVTPPKLRQKTEPQYTDIARMDKLQGTVILMLEVGTDGVAHNIQLKQGVGLGLDENAAEALSKWSFVPGTKNGQPVPVMATVEVNFRLY